MVALNLGSRIMASITVKNIPEHLLDRVRKLAAKDHRSLNKEFLHLIELALRGERADPAGRVREQVETQAAAWSELAGRWQSDLDKVAETEAIYAARSTGRPVDL